MSKTPRPKIGVVADVHLGNFNQFGGVAGLDGLNDRGRFSVGALKRALLQAEDSQCDAFFVAGDLFHSRRPEPAVIAAAQRTVGGSGRQVVVIPGNHDAVDSSPSGGNTACETLAMEVDVPRVPEWVTLPGLSVLVVPFTAEVPMRQHLEEVLSSRDFATGNTPDCPMILVTHIGVTDQATSPWLRDKNDAIDSDKLLDLLEFAGMDGAFVGNYHQGQIWKRSEGPFICQVGTLCPAGHGDDGVFPQVGGMAVWSPGMAVPEMVEIPGPRFLTLQPGEALPNLLPECKTYVRAMVAPDGTKPDTVGATGVKEVPQVEAKDLGPIPTQELQGAEEAIVSFCKANAIPADIMESALAYYRKAQ